MVEWSTQTGPFTRTFTTGERYRPGMAAPPGYLARPSTVPGHIGETQYIYVGPEPTEQQKAQMESRGRQAYMERTGYNPQDVLQRRDVVVGQVMGGPGTTYKSQVNLNTGIGTATITRVEPERSLTVIPKMPPTPGINLKTFREAQLQSKQAPEPISARYDPKYGLMVTQQHAIEKAERERLKRFSEHGIKPSGISKGVSKKAFEISTSIRGISVPAPPEIKGSIGWAGLKLGQESTARLVEFGGISPGTAEILGKTAIKAPATLPGALAYGTVKTSEAMLTEAQTNPAQFLSDLAVTGGVIKGAGKIAKLPKPSVKVYEKIQPESIPGLAVVPKKRISAKIMLVQKSKEAILEPVKEPVKWIEVEPLPLELVRPDLFPALTKTKVIADAVSVTKLKPLTKQVSVVKAVPLSGLKAISESIQVQKAKTLTGMMAVPMEKMFAIPATVTKEVYILSPKTMQIPEPVQIQGVKYKELVISVPAMKIKTVPVSIQEQKLLQELKPVALTKMKTVTWPKLKETTKPKRMKYQTKKERFETYRAAPIADPWEKTDKLFRTLKRKSKKKKGKTWLG